MNNCLSKRIMQTLCVSGWLCVALVIQSPNTALSHCQVPCGIYDDEARFSAMQEHITTIEKSMNQIGELAADAGANINQLTRWVNNKEKHADKLAHIVSYYFLAQRIKAPTEDSEQARDSYLEKLELLHQMTVSAMKCKQTTDLKHVENFRNSLEKFHQAYIGH